MMRPGSPALDHAGCKDLRAVDHAPEVDAENTLPVWQRTEHLAARLDAGVVHQNVGAAEPFSHGAFQFRHLLDAADVDCARQDIGGAAGRCRRQCGFGRLQPIAAEIGDTDFHAEARKFFRGGKAEAGGAAGDDGNMVGRHGWMGHGRFLPMGISLAHSLCQSRAWSMHETAWELFIRRSLQTARPALRFHTAAIEFYI